MFICVKWQSAYKKHYSETLVANRIVDSIREYALSARVPESIRRNQRALPAGGREILIKSLTDNFFSDPYYYPEPPAVYLRTPEGQKDLENGIEGQVNRVRNAVVP